MKDFYNLLLGFESTLESYLGSYPQYEQSQPLDFEFLFFIKLVLFLGCFAFFFFTHHFYQIKRESISQSKTGYILIFFIGILYYYLIISACFSKLKIKILLLILVLLSLLVFGLFQTGGLKNLFNYFEYRLRAHLNKPMSFDTLALIWSAYKESSPTYLLRQQGGVHYNALCFAWMIVVLFVIKEVMKKIILYFIIAAFYKCFFVEALFYIINYLLVIFLVSLIAIDKDMVNFISNYFGPFVLGWLGSYQYIDPSYPKFIPASEFKWSHKSNQ